jgi:hypothetical protein
MHRQFYVLEMHDGIGIDGAHLHELVIVVVVVGI